ncbi:MAG: immunoglobulin domain-containing protein [Limisphaerales bacterium]
MKTLRPVIAVLTLSISTLAQTWIQWPIAQGGSGHWYGPTRGNHRGWGQAEAEAQTYPNGHLVSINSAAEQKFLETTFLAGENVRNTYWIGFNDFEREGQWVWSTGEQVTFTNWGPGEPNDAGNEDGAVLNWPYFAGNVDFGTWNDMPEHYFHVVQFAPQGLIEVQSTVPPVTAEVTPRDQTALPGSTATFRAFTYGVATHLSYQWRLDGADIPGATNDTLSLTQLKRSQSGDYSVLVRLPEQEVLTQPATLRVFGPPSIETQPVSRTVTEGQSAEMSVGVSGEGPFAFEWFINAVPIPGANRRTLSLSNVKPTQAGSYSVRVTNLDGSTLSTSAKLTVIPPGYTILYANDFEQDAASEWSSQVTTATLVGARKHLGPVRTGAIELTLPDVPAQADLLLTFDLYLLDAWVGNSHDSSVWSLKAAGGRELLRTTFSNVQVSQSYPESAGVDDFPRFAGATEYGTLSRTFYHVPESMDSVYGLRFLVPHSGGPVVFTFEAPGPEPIENRSWGLDNVVVAVATVAPESAPEILHAPESQVLRLGETAVFKVLASGSAPLRYQWRFDNTPIVGATNNLLTIHAVTADDAGRYGVVVENDYGLISKSPAQLAVVTWEPSGQTVNAGLAAEFAVEISGEANLQWRFNGSDISGATNSTLQLGPAQPELAGRYTVHITSGGRSFESAPASLAVPLPNEPGSKLWEFDTGSPMPGILGSPAVAQDGTVYVGTVSGGLVALNSSGSERWRVMLGPIAGSPAVGGDGTVYVGAGGAVYAISPSGQMLWSTVVGGWIHASPAIAADGTIYVAGINLATPLFALNPDGTEKWRFDASARIYSSPAIGADGTIYFATLDDTGVLFALRPDGTELWRSPARGNGAYASPAIATDGSVFFGGDRVYSLNRGGSRRWEFSSWNFFSSSGAVNREGEVFQTDLTGLLHVVSPRGMLVRSVDLGARAQYTGVAISDQGTAYLFAEDLRLRAVSSAGLILWEYATGGRVTLATPHVRPSPTIGPDGTIYLCGLDGKLHAIKGDGPPAPGGWPMFRHDAQHTGRMPLLLEATNLKLMLGDNAAFWAVTGEQGATFQWRHNGAILPDATNSVLTLSEVTLSQAGGYDVTVTYDGGTARSHTETLVVVHPIIVFADLRRTPAGQWEFEFASQLTVPVTLEASVDLADWQTMTTFPAGAAVHTWTEPAEATHRARFFRTRQE